MAGRIPRRFDVPVRDSRHSGTAARPAGRCPAGRPRHSLAEALEALPVRGQISRSFLESPDARAGKLQRTLMAFLRRHQVQATPNDLRFGAPCRLFQPLEHSAVFVSKARMDVGLHFASVAHSVITVLHRQRRAGVLTQEMADENRTALSASSRGTPRTSPVKHDRMMTRSRRSFPACFSTYNQSSPEQARS